MSLIKHIVAQGMYYTSIGVRDYAEWSRMLIDEFGPEIKPSIRHIRKWSLILPEIMNCGREPRINCWEFMGCGLHVNGDFIGPGEVALCPACSDKKRKGLHGGKNAGRACWLVSGTLCSGTRQETAKQKHAMCIPCDFYALVIDEEDGNKITPLS
jgi:hypothetical protein